MCVWGGRESFSGRASPVWTDHDAAAAAAQFSLERARARAFCQIKESDYGVRAITGRSRRSARSFVGLPYASSEMRPNLFAFYRAPSLSKREKKGRERISLSRAMRFGSRSRPRVRVHEAYLACVFIF